MYFLDKRVQVICNELKKLAIKKKKVINHLKFKNGKYITPKEAHFIDDFRDFYSGQTRWFGPDEHYWFTADIEVPAGFEGDSLWFNIRTQIEEWDDAKNPQFLLFIDEVPIQGIDMNHREVFIKKDPKEGDTFKVDLQAYTGTLHKEFHLLFELLKIDEDIMSLYWDLQVPLYAFSRLDAQSQSKLKIENILNETINILDLRVPYSEEFYSSIESARHFIKRNLYDALGGYDDVIATCIGHTHIDVAWWWTVDQTRQKACRSFATVLKLMDEYPNYKFMSSQPQLYQFVKERHPDLYERIKQRVKEGRWEVEGSTWVEMDCNLTSGESLVRQFIHGKKFFKSEFDKDNKILWLPDVFGYSAALPQIMKECGVDYFMTTKLSWNQFNKHPYDTFMWHGIDGTAILTHLITTLGVGQNPKDYFTTYNGNLHPDAIMGGWERYQNKDINNDILISYGYGDGGGGPTRDMLEISKRMECGITSIPKVRQETARVYFEELDKRVRYNKRLPYWSGELYFEYHRGTLTSMARNKRSNRKSEFAMMDLELLSVLSMDKIKYPNTDALWKTILINQFHDILPGSSIHEVYEVTKKEYKELSKNIALLMKERESLLFEPSNNITILNTKGFVSDEILLIEDINCKALKDAEGNIYPIQEDNGLSYVYLKNLPAKGYKTFSISDVDNIEKPFDLKDDYDIETPYYIVKFNEVGQIIRLYDKENDREVLKENKLANELRVFEDKPIYYDNWDIDIFYTEKSWMVDNLLDYEWTSIGNTFAKLKLKYSFSNSLIEQEIVFYANSRRIDFNTLVNWKEHQHLLKVFFPTNIHTDEATYDIQFGNIKRKTHQNTSWDVARFEACGQKWADVSEGSYGVSLLNDCKYGYGIKHGILGLSLIKSGIEPNPVTDQEQHTFTYSLLPHTQDFRNVTAIESYKLNQPAHVIKGGNCFDGFSLCSVDKKNIFVETIKEAEDKDGVIVRLYENDGSLTKAKLLWHYDILNAQENNCLEEYKDKLEFTQNEIDFVIKPYEIKTFRIKYKR